jgi:hypothetical protein
VHSCTKERRVSVEREVVRRRSPLLLPPLRVGRVMEKGAMMWEVVSAVVSDGRRGVSSSSSSGLCDS